MICGDWSSFSSACSWLSAWPALAQQGQSSVQGRVSDSSGLALPGVTITVIHEGSGVFRNLVSNADGSYFATGLVPGPVSHRGRARGLPQVPAARACCCRSAPPRRSTSRSTSARWSRTSGDRRIAAGGREIHAGGDQHRSTGAGGAADSQSQLAGRGVAGSGNPAAVVDGVVRVRIVDRRRRQQPQRQFLGRWRRQ